MVGSGKATHRKLTALARELKATGSLVCGRDREIRPGAQLAREWRGRTHKVVVTKDGFDYAGRPTPLDLTDILDQRRGDYCIG
jgi:hypothetical protein